MPGQCAPQEEDAAESSAGKRQQAKKIHCLSCPLDFRHSFDNIISPLQFQDTELARAGRLAFALIDVCDARC